MKIAVLGGLGLQGRAAIADLVASAGVEEVVCVDTAPDGAARLGGLTDLSRVRFVVPEGAIGTVLADVMTDVDAVIDLLPQPLMREAVQAAIATRTPLVTTNYGKAIADLAPAAEKAGVSIMTECGLDPGIDLVLYARAARQFDTITAIDSYCGGIPEPKAMAKPLCYKVSWNFDMVLISQNRDSVIIEDGERVEVAGRPAARQPFHPRDRGRWARPAGSLPQWRCAALCRDARRRQRAAALRPLLAALAGVVGVLGAAEAARLPLRRQGAGRLSAQPARISRPAARPATAIWRRREGPVRDAQCLSRHEGGRRKTVTSDLIIERDLKSGLFGMSLGVGYPASIVAQMLARREITEPGLLNPLRMCRTAASSTNWPGAASGVARRCAGS